MRVIVAVLALVGVASAMTVRSEFIPPVTARFTDLHEFRCPGVMYLTPENASSVLTNCTASTSPAAGETVVTARRNSYMEGWDYIRFTVNDTVDAMLPEFTTSVMGYAEGVLNADRISQRYSNVVLPMILPSMKKLLGFANSQLAYMRKVAANKTNVPVRAAIGVAFWLASFDGLVAGHRKMTGANSSLSLMEVEIFALTTVEEIRSYANYNGITLGGNYVSAPRGMSAVRNAGDDVFVAQSSTRTIIDTMRSYRGFESSRYNMSFTSYPGAIGSTDDFYVSANGLIVMSSPLEIWSGLNHNSHQMHASSIPSAVRGFMATLFARTPDEWHMAFAWANSGADNRQWVLFDTSRVNVTNGTVHSGNLPAGTCWVVEQSPNGFSRADVTSTLQHNHRVVVAMGVPITPQAAADLGYDMLARRDGFGSLAMMNSTRIQQAVMQLKHANTTLDMQHAVRYNNYMASPESHIPWCAPSGPHSCMVNASNTTNGTNVSASPVIAVAERRDLAPAYIPGPHPAAKALERAFIATIDGKVTSVIELRRTDNLGAFVISGPTRNATYNIPALDMTKAKTMFASEFMHRNLTGYPTVFNYAFVNMTGSMAIVPLPKYHPSLAVILLAVAGVPALFIIIVFAIKACNRKKAAREAPAEDTQLL